MYIRSCVEVSQDFQTSGSDWLCYYCINDNVWSSGIQGIVGMSMTIFIHLGPCTLNLSRNWINGKIKLQ